MGLFGDYAYSNYTSQFVERPTDLLVDESDRLQTKYDASKLASNKLKMMADSIQSMKEQKPILERELAKYEEGLKQMSEKGNWEDMGVDVETLALDLNQNMKQGKLGTLINNYSNYQEYLKKKQELETSGKYAEWNDDYKEYMQSNWDAESKGFNFEKTGDIAAYTFGGLGEMQDHEKRASEMMKSIASDSSMKDYVSLDAEGNIVGFKGMSEGVARQKVMDIAEGKADQFLMTQEGRDFAKMMQYYGGGQMDASTLHRNAADYLATTALNQVYNKTQEGNSFQYRPKWVDEQNKLEEALMNPSTTYLEGESNQAQELTKTLDELKVDKDGNVIISDDAPAIDGQAPALTYGPGGGGAYLKTNRKKTANEIKAEKTEKQKVVNHIITKFDELNPKLKDWTPQQKVKAYQEARKNNQTVTPTVMNLTTDAMSEQTQLAAKNNNLALMSGRRFKVNGEEFGNVNDLIDGLGLHDRKKYTIAVKGVSSDDPYGMVGGEVISVTTNDGKAHTIYTSPATKELESAYGDTRQLMIAARSGKPQQVVKVSDNEEYVVINTPRQDNQGKFRFSTRVIMRHKDPKTGQWHSPRNSDGSKEFSLDQVLYEQHNRRMPQLNNYYNSNFNASKDDKAEE